MLIINSLKIQMKNFSWGGNGATLSRLKRQTLLLPTKNGSPDWGYMEQYAKNMIYMKLKGYLEYVEKTQHL